METSFKCTDQLFKMYNNNLREIEPPKFTEDTEGCFSIINEREHEMRDFVPFINLQIIKSKFNEKMFIFIKNIQELFNDLMNCINFRLNESTKLKDMTYEDIVQYNNQRINEDKESDSDSDFSKQLKIPDSNESKNNNSNSNNINENEDKSSNNKSTNSKSRIQNKINNNITDDKRGYVLNISNNKNDNYKDDKIIPSIFISGKKKDKEEGKTQIKSKKKLFPLLLDSNKKNKINLLNKIKENTLNGPTLFKKDKNTIKNKDKINKDNKEEEDNVKNDNNNNILLKTILNKKSKKNINLFPLIKTKKKNGNKSDINIKSLDEKEIKKKNKSLLSHQSIDNITKSKSQLKLKIFDTINTKIKNLKKKDKAKTENNFIHSNKSKQIKINENQNLFSS